MRRFLAPLLLAAAGLLIAPAALADVLDVHVYNFEFNVNQPGQPVVDAVIEVGDTVRWVSLEGNHTTTSVAGIAEQWHGDLSSSTPNYAHTFTNVGTFHYYCLPHGFDNGDGTAGGMAGTVTVLPSGSGACCLSNGSCVNTSPATCLLQGGVYQGNGTDCATNPCPNQAVTVELLAAADNVLYESATGSTSNGAGRYLYAGNQSNGLKRRTVIRFDLSSIPATAAIQSATLRLYCNQSSGSSVPLSVQRLTASWGEGTSDAGGDESSGTTATAGDATWIHRFHPSTAWLSAGGDFAAAPSAVYYSAGSSTFYAWSAPGLAADVQSWIDLPGANHGWILRGDEASTANTKRFDSRQGNTPANAPRLLVTYLPVAPTGACCDPSGACTSETASICAARGGAYHGDGSACGAVTCGPQLAPFVDPLPLPAIADPVSGTPGGAAHYEIEAREILQQLHRDLPPTRVWGYDGSYPGPTIEARRGEPVTVVWKNELRDLATGALRTTHALPVDTCLHGPDMTGTTPVIVTHLHGGHVPAESDGYPEASFPPGDQSSLYTYPNEQPAATLWYHDHALGITRLNVIMGLAGFYLLRDDAEEALDLPSGAHEIALAIQDRSFHVDGSLAYPEMWHDHFAGDFVLVNGKVWPYLDVQRGKYRFRMLNGSTTRTYRLELSNDATFWQIGTDTGLLPAPVALTSLLLSPGERADLVIDFEPYAAGTAIVLENDAPTPFPGTPGVGVVPNVMQFRVQGAFGHLNALPASLVPVPLIDPSSSLVQRDLVLRQYPDTHCPSHMDGVWLIDGLGWHDVTEMPRLDTVETWAWINRSPIMHPMHMHLVAFQVLDRQAVDPVTGTPIGTAWAPEPNELGWKDTVQCPPSTVTRVIARFEDYMGDFPYHCHILEHEDHEMMRQFRVVANAQSYCSGDGTQAVACPCSNSGAEGHGCANSANPDGALLEASGSTHADTLTLSSAGEPPTSFSILLQGTSDLALPVLFGDGLRCVGGSLKRLYVRAASAGSVTFPPPGEPSISERSAILGDPLTPGTTRGYQVYYRDAVLEFCPSPPGNSWNASNAQRVTW